MKLSFGLRDAEVRASQVAPERAFAVLDSDGSDLKDLSTDKAFK